MTFKRTKNQIIISILLLACACIEKPQLPQSDEEESPEIAHMTADQSCDSNGDCGADRFCCQSQCIESSLSPENCQACLSLSTNSLDFGEVPRGEVSTQEVILTSCSEHPVTISEISQNIINSTFSIESPSPLPVTLAPLESLTLSVNYVPNYVGQNSDVLRISSNDAQDSLKLVNLDGVAIQPRLEDVGLHILLEWDSSKDMDLHLVQNDNLWSCDDCHYLNKTPEWGVPLENLDNPYLDKDVISGYGPENINLSRPLDQKYKVVVHYFSSAQELPIDTNVTVTIYHYGEEIGRFTKLLTRLEELWTVAEIEFPNAVVTLIDELIVQDRSTRTFCSE